MSENIYSLTNPQKSIWLSEQTYQNMYANSICGTLLFNDKVDTNLIKEAIKIFIQKNASMNTRIILDNGEPKQCFIKNDIPQVEILGMNSTDELHKLEEKSQKHLLI